MHGIGDWCSLKLPGVASTSYNSFPIAIVARTNAEKYINSVGTPLRLTPNLIQGVASRTLGKEQARRSSAHLPELWARNGRKPWLRLVQFARSQGHCCRSGTCTVFVLLVLPTLYRAYNCLASCVVRFRFLGQLIGAWKEWM